MADTRTRQIINTEIAEARESFLAADLREDYVAGDYWFARLRELSDEAAHVPHPRPQS